MGAGSPRFVAGSTDSRRVRRNWGLCRWTLGRGRPQRVSSNVGLVRTNWWQARPTPGLLRRSMGRVPPTWGGIDHLGQVRPAFGPMFGGLQPNLACLEADPTQCRAESAEYRGWFDRMWGGSAEYVARRLTPPRRRSRRVCLRKPSVAHTLVAAAQQQPFRSSDHAAHLLHHLDVRGLR